MSTPHVIDDFMTECPVSVDSSADVTEARAFLQKYQIHHLPVTLDGALVGIVTDADIKLVLGPDFAYPREQELKIADLYRDNTYLVESGTPLTEVVDTLVGKPWDAALITNNGKLIGLFTLMDACKALQKLLAQAATG